MSVRVSNGVNTLSADLAGQTLGEIRTACRQALNIDPAAKVYLNGDEGQPDTMVEDEDNVQFIKASGSKGLVD